MKFKRKFRIYFSLAVIAILIWVLCFGIIPIRKSTNDYEILNVNSKQRFIVKERPSASRIPIILVTSGRSGSSFLGELLKQNERLLYHFEPLRMVNILHTEKGDDLNEDSSNLEAISYFDDIFSCNVSNDKLDLFKSEPRSKYSLENNGLSSNLYNNVCKKDSTHVLVKELFDRFPYTVNHVTSKLDNQNVKVLFLVRDLRATVFSMMKAKMFNGAKLKKVNNKIEFEVDWNKIDSFCKKIHDNFNSVILSRNDFMVIRYEELSQHVVYKLQKILDFLLLENTSCEILKSFETFKEDQQNRTRKKGNHDTRFITSKDTQGTFQKWRKEIPLDLSIGIERQCKDVMKVFEYKIIGSNIELLHNISYDLH